MNGKGGHVGRVSRAPLSRTERLLIYALALGCVAAVEVAGGEPDERPAELRLQLAAGQTLRYGWAIESASDSKGQELGKPLDLRTQRSMRMAVVLEGAQPPQGETGLAAALRFENVALQENRIIGDAARSVLRVDRQDIQFTENNRVLIDTRNDVGVEKISPYQRALRGLERSAARLLLDAAGRQTRVEGDRLLLEAAHAGQAAGLFPALAGAAAKPGAAWEGQFEIPSLADVRLERPALVRTRTTFAKWDRRDGRDVVLLDMLAAWESRDLEGRDAAGLTVRLTRLEGQGAGSYSFDPRAGCFVEGVMTFRLRYRLEGERQAESTALDVSGRGRFSFRLEKQ